MRPISFQLLLTPEILSFQLLLAKTNAVVYIFKDFFILECASLKTPAKNHLKIQSAFVVCCKSLLRLFNKVKYRDKQCSPRLD